jgi:deoxycytidine triphosphate deaminase
MILSDGGIKNALSVGSLAISPAPEENQYTTSAVDLILGKAFLSWDEARFNIPGAKVELNLAEQNFADTAEGYLKDLKPEQDGCLVLPPYHKVPRVVLAITREKCI